jgi:hypothetical protein
MQLPNDLETLVKQFTRPLAATLRPNWRDGSETKQALIGCEWWEDYQLDMSKTRVHGWRSTHGPFMHMNPNSTWHDWCYSKMIIGPPRYRSEREITENGLDDEYLQDDDIERHFLPWVDTWPASDDHSWCKPRGVPYWAATEYIGVARA